MCEVCHMSRCPAGCPNAPDPPAVTTCHRCGDSITPGSEYARIDGLDYCEGCMDDMPYCENVPLLGGEWNIVGEGKKVKCDACEEELEEGEEYGVIDGKVYCEECIWQLSYSELVTKAGHDWRTASEEDIYDGYDG